MIKKILILFALFLTSSSYSSVDELKIYDTLAFKKMVYLKIESIDTIPGFINYHNNTSQYEYSQIFCTNLRIGFNAKTSFEILAADSKIEPHVNVHIKFKDLYTHFPKVKDKRRCYTSSTIEIIGKNPQDKKSVFSATSRRKSKGKDLQDELRDNIIEIARDTYDEFEDLRHRKIKKSFQYYDFTCKDLKEIHYTFINVTNLESTRLLYDVADAEIQNESIEHTYPLKRLYLKQIDSILIKEPVDFNKRNNVASQELQTYLLNKGINSLLIIHSLNCDLPFEYDRDVTFPVPVPGGGMAWITLFSVGVNDVDNAFCKMFLLDVQHNKCLISTQIYGDDGEDIADHIIEAIGYFNEKTVEIEPCFD